MSNIQQVLQLVKDKWKNKLEVISEDQEVSSMSQYLTISKDNIDIISFSRSHLVYEAFSLSYTEEYKELEKNCIQSALSYSEERIKNINHSIKHEKLMVVDKLSNISDMCDVLRTIEEWEEELQSWKFANSCIQFISMIHEQCDNESKLFYKVG